MNQHTPLFRSDFMENIIKHIREELKNNVDEKTKVTSQNFFKERIKSYGVKMPVVNRISKDSFKTLESVSKSEVFDLCEKLWQSEYLEESFIACNWSYSLRKKFKPEDFTVFEKWIQLIYPIITNSP